MFYKPSRWGFIKVKNFENLRNQQVLGNGFDEIKDQVWEELGDPIIVITKYFEEKPEHKGIFSPTITLNITPKEELKDLDFESFEEQIELSAIGTSMILVDFEIIKERESYFISGIKFFDYNATYSFGHIEIEKPLKVELKVLKAEHNGFYYDFNMHQSSEQNQLAGVEFQRFKNSIKLI